MKLRLLVWRSLHFDKDLLGFLLFAVLSVLVYSDILGRLDDWIYDWQIRHSGRSPPEDMVIVAIDEHSLDELGRWPWPRQRHTELMKELTRQRAKVVGFNIMFTEPDAQDPESDAALAAAIREHGRVVLPVSYESNSSGLSVREVLPIQRLAQAAASLGHVDADADPDGLVRSVFLRAGLGSPRWPAFGYAMLELDQPHVQEASLLGERNPHAVGSSLAGVWVRDNRMLIPFSGPPGHFKQVSYVDVLQRRLPVDTLRDKYVLVGVTANHLGDTLPTPVTARARPMSGVEFHGHILTALQNSVILYPMAPVWRLACLAILILIPLRLYSQLTSLQVLGLTVGLGILTLAGSLLLMRIANIWLAPAPALAVLLLEYLWWFWRRLESMTRSLEKRERQMDFLSTHDPLTKLPNPELFRSQLDQAIAYAMKTRQSVGVLCIGLDRMKIINNTLSLSAGNALLKAVARRLKSRLRDGQIVARLGGDEFAVVVEGVMDQKEAARIAKRLLDLTPTPFIIEEKDVFVTCSIGISLYPRDSEDANTLLKCADIAMRRAKKQGGNQSLFYSKEMDVKGSEHLTLEKELRKAVTNGELELFFQPQLELASSRIIGTEALVRWRHPRRGFIHPSQFVPLAEEIGLIIPLGQWVFRAACLQAKVWCDMGISRMRMSVNLSPRQFMDKNILVHIAEALDESRLDPALLELEITENLMLEDLARCKQILGRLKEMGSSVSIDDFGTGYSSLSYLKRLPIDQLKIDQSFVRDIVTDPDDAAITSAVIAMTQKLGIGVVAEGVESEAQALFLKHQHCQQIQGYYVSPPAPAKEITRFLQENRTRHIAVDIDIPPERTLLIVDDDTNMLELLRTLLSRDGYHVLTARSAHEGLELMAQHAVGVLVSDEFMSEMNGTEFLRRVRRLHPETVRILLSGLDQLHLLINALNEGAIFKFLKKPISEEQLHETLREAFLLYTTRLEKATFS